MAGGRPTKLTPEVQKQICDAIEAGNYIETAAAYAGINKDTLYRWLRDGARAKKGKKKNFSDAVQKALAKSEMRDVYIIGKAAENQWQAAAWRLERKFPDRWGRKDKQRLEHTGKDGGAIQVENVREKIESRISSVAAKIGEGEDTE